jgi:hypothetical protein
MATWSADGKEVPQEIRAALAPGGPLPDGPADAHVHVRSGVGSFLGETHLVVAGGRFRVAGRSTSLDPWAELVLSGRPRLDDSGYRPVLLLPTRAGEQRLEVTSLEEAAVEDLLAALPPISIVLRPSPGPAGDAGAPVLAAVEDDLPDLVTMRAALLGTLARRIKQRRAELLAARHARRTVGIDHRVGTHRAHDERWKARHARRTRKVEPEVLRGVVPEARTPADSALRLLGVAVLGAAVFFLFAFLGRALSSRP